jgi:hypothetical protein
VFKLAPTDFGAARWADVKPNSTRYGLEGTGLIFRLKLYSRMLLGFMTLLGLTHGHACD